MAALHLRLLYFNILILFSQCILIDTYTLTSSKSIADGDTLVSQGGIYELGFFSPSTTSKNRYLGIWFKTITVQTVVWVANRDAPLNDTSGVLKIDSTGKLVLVNDHTNRVVWSSNSSKAVQKYIVLELLRNGNLALRDLRNNDSRSYLWQSFDYPSDSLLPGMKLGWDSKSGINRYLTSWRNFDDPSTGDFIYGLDLTGYPQFVMLKGSDKYYRGGSWNGLQDSGSPEIRLDKKYVLEFVNNAKETFFRYNLVNHSTIFRLVLIQTSFGGVLQRMTWADITHAWALEKSQPRDRCDSYALCGAYGTCDLNYVDVCVCFQGFKPKSRTDWSELDWSQGCERRVPINCSKGDGFRKYARVKLPDTANSWTNTSMTLEECRVKCLNNCSCMAYANADVRDGGSGCILWLTDLLDMRQLSGAGQDLYIRLAASELDLEVEMSSVDHVKSVVSILSVAGIFTLGLGISFVIWKKKSLQGATKMDDIELPLYSNGDDLELTLYDLISIRTATNNFSNENKLGEGGFGPVYKGILDGEEIAVKRLSKSSTQGVSEFKNEVKLISKLQHRNLVRILGCCVQGEESMLVYEYVQNNSLGSFIFDEAKSSLLDWEKRFEIILGIARGLLYLHHDSRLRIIHRDLKLGNILLDHEMVPKISDFGIARIFKGDDNAARTKRIVGTHGYMAPEYILEGHFSVKSDVFSFGVVILEIISGKKNRGFHHPDHQANLLGHAWRLWGDDKCMELVDLSMIDSCRVQDVTRCIHVGLLCVQKGREQRPTMSSVVMMLSSENAVLPRPQPPAFYIERSIPTGENLAYSDEGVQCSGNEASVSLLEPR